MTKDEILKRCEEWFAAYMHDRESYDEATVLLAAIRNGATDEPSGDHCQLQNTRVCSAWPDCQCGRTIAGAFFSAQNRRGES